MGRGVQLCNDRVTKHWDVGTNCVCKRAPWHFWKHFRLKTQKIFFFTFTCFFSPCFFQNFKKKQKTQLPKNHPSRCTTLQKSRSAMHNSPKSGVSLDTTPWNFILELHNSPKFHLHLHNSPKVFFQLTQLPKNEIFRYTTPLKVTSKLHNSPQIGKTQLPENKTCPYTTPQIFVIRMHNSPQKATILHNSPNCPHHLHNSQPNSSSEKKLLWEKKTSSPGNRTRTVGTFFLG